MGRRRRVGTGADDFAVGFVVIDRTTSRSQHGYDRLAAAYPAIEWLAFGRQLQSARVALIDELPPWRRLLILGDGDGRLLERLVQKQFHDRSQTHQDHVLGGITSVDQSAAMLRRQRERIAASGVQADVEFIQADACHYEPAAGAYDVIVTPFFLDCFPAETLNVCLPQWLRGLRCGGSFYHVDFTRGDFNQPDRNVVAAVWRRLRARTLLCAMHVFFRWQTGLENRQLVDTEAALMRCGLQNETQQIGCGGMTTTQIWRFPT